MMPIIFLQKSAILMNEHLVVRSQRVTCSHFVAVKIFCARYYRGQWHGDVAIKMLHMDPDTDNAAQLSAFKLEVNNRLNRCK